MTTQVAFATDQKLKTAVSKKLKANGMTLKGFFNYCMKAYQNGAIDFGITYGKNYLLEENNNPTVFVSHTPEESQHFLDSLKT